MEIGSQLGPYRIVSKLGEGGMGVVYAARDSRLDRSVAIKLLLEAFARDPDRLARFEREAKVLASLNHPHIAHLYGIEESGSSRALVMELVEGPTLADRLAEGPIPLDEALPIARQIADALEAAHAQGVVHRDLKPANIKLRADGSVKVLDFGLAKLSENGGASGLTPMSSPTMLSPVTSVGVILGTAAYMSPEQARGRPVDERTDLWAFGCVLFEMLTGRRPFEPGETVSDAIAAILTREPDWGALPPATPASVRRLLRRCLSKDPVRRLRHAADARLDLDDAVAEHNAPGSLPQQPRSLARATALPWAIAAVAWLVAAVAAWQGWGAVRTPSRPAQTTRLEVNLPPGVELYSATTRTVGVAPDGMGLSFVGTSGGTRQLYLRRFDRFEATPIRGTDGATTSFFSPDGQKIGFVSSAGELKTVSLVDGLVVTVAKDASLLWGATWTADGRLVFVRRNALWTVGQDGGEAAAVTTREAGVEMVHAYPMALPDRRTLLFAVQVNGRWHIEALTLATGERREVLADATLPLLGPDGYLFFYRDGQLLAVRFDQRELRPVGAPIQARDNVPEIAIGTPVADVSAAGVLVFTPGSARRQLVWVSRSGVEEPVTDTIRSYINPRLSPDGTRILVQAGTIWTFDLERKSFELMASQFTEGNAFPIWLDARRVIYRSGVGLRVQPLDGGPGETVSGSSEFDYPSGLAADGKTLVFNRSTSASSFDILMAPYDSFATATPIVQTEAYEGGAQLSADGTLMAFVSNETGRNEIFVRRLSASGGRRQVSVDGGTQPMWNPNGREIFYRIGDRMMAVAVTTAGETISLSQPVVLFERQYAYGAGITISNFDVSRDGQRFLMIKDEPASGRLRVVLNWTPESSGSATPAPR